MGTYQSGKSAKVLRDELYRQVWQTPLRRLAPKYGIGGAELAKVCRRLNVPYPPVGHWAKLEAKKPVQILPLPPATADTPKHAVIMPMNVDGSAHFETKKRRERYQATLKELPSITVSQTLDDPHPIVGLWLADRDKAVEAAKRSRSGPTPKLTELNRRRYLILDTLFKELERRGIEIQATQYRGPWVQIGRERVDFRLYEKMRHIRRPLTTDEKKSWLYAGRESMQEKVLTGRLAFKITTYLDTGIPVEWIDSDLRPLEQKLAEIVAVFVMAGPVLGEKDRRLEEDRRRYERADRRRGLKIAREEREHSRWIRFLELSTQWHTAETVRQFLAKLEIDLPAGHASFGRRTHTDWLIWAREWLKTHDPLENGVETVWRDLADVPLEYPSSESFEY